MAREVVDALGAGYCVIWEYDEDEDAIVERAGFSLDPGYTVDGDVIELDERPREREILFSREPVIETLSDPGLDAQSRESMERWGEKTCLSLPLRFGDTPLGVLGVCETERERRFTRGGAPAGARTRHQASAAVHNARVYRDLAERHRELEVRARRERLLNELGVELSSSLDPRTVLDSACRRICELLEATGGEIWARRDEQQVECLASWANGGFVEEWVGRRYPLDHWSASSLAMDTGETVAIVSLDDPRLGAEERRVMEEWDQRSLLAVPMQARGRTLGTVEITQAGRERAFTQDEVAIAEACARLTALAVDNALLFERQAARPGASSPCWRPARRSRPRWTSRTCCARSSGRPPRRWAAPRRSSSRTTPTPTRSRCAPCTRSDPTVYEDLDKPYPLDEYPSDREALEAVDVIVETISDPGLPADVRESMEYHGEKTCLTVPLQVRGHAAGHADARGDGGGARVHGGGARVRARASPSRRPWPCTTRSSSRT